MYLVSVVRGSMGSDEVVKSLGKTLTYSRAIKKLERAFLKYYLENIYYYRKMEKDNVFYYDFGSWTYFGRIEKVK